jgi:hypothetical protein
VQSKRFYTLDTSEQPATVRGTGWVGCVFVEFKNCVFSEKYLSSVFMNHAKLEIEFEGTLASPDRDVVTVITISHISTDFFNCIFRWCLFSPGGILTSTVAYTYFTNTNHSAVSILANLKYDRASMRTDSN